MNMDYGVRFEMEIKNREQLINLINELKEKGEHKLSIEADNINLHEIDFRDFDLINCCFRNCGLQECHFDICKAVFFSECDLRYARFFDGIISDCFFCGCNCGATDFRETVMIDVRFEFSDLISAQFDDDEKIRRGIVLSAPMIGYKKLEDESIAKLLIPKGAVVFSVNHKKCRTNKAKVVRIINRFGMSTKNGVSMYDPSFTYRKGKTYTIENFDFNYNYECGSGIHFFLTEAEAREYNY